MTSRILYLIGQLRLGGYERQLYYLLTTINRVKFKPAVAVWNATDGHLFTGKIRALDIPIHVLPAERRLGKMLAFRRLVKSLSPEVVHSYSFYTNFPAWWGTLGTSAIPVGSIRGTFSAERTRAGGILGCLSARWPADQICNSADTKADIAKATGVFSPSRVTLVPNGLDVRQFPVTTPPLGTPTILAVGRLYSVKRWDRLITAAATLNRRGLSFRIRHAGDGPLRETLLAQARLLGVGHLVEFLGVRQDIPALLAESSFLVHTAEDEGCPNVVMEAMACARAVIATDAGHCPALVADGKTGYVVARGRDEELADRMATLIEEPDLVLSMGSAGRAKAEQEFSLDRLVDGTLSAYAQAGWQP